MSLSVDIGLPLNPNIYGLGEVVASSGFRRDVKNTIQTMWARDVGDPVDEYVSSSLSLALRLLTLIRYGLYGTSIRWKYQYLQYLPISWRIFTQVRWQTCQTDRNWPSSLNRSAGGDILLFTPPSSQVSLVEYRMVGGVLDFYFFSGPTPNKHIEQYGALIGFTNLATRLGFGFHLCRYLISCFVPNRTQRPPTPSITGGDIKISLKPVNRWSTWDKQTYP
jgi:alpha-glucosidase